MKDARIVLGTGDLVELDGMLYFAATNLPGFFQYNKLTGELASLQLEPSGKGGFHWSGYIGACKSGDRIVFVPCYARNILIYDVKNPKKSKKIDIEPLVPNSIQFYYTVAYSNLVYFFGWNSSEIICLNMDTEEICAVDTWKKAVAAAVGSYRFIGVHTCDMCVLNGSIWMPLSGQGCILEMSLQTNKVRVHKVLVSNMVFATICFDGTDFWMTGNRQKIVRWNTNSGKTEVIDVFPNGFKANPGEDEYYFSGSFYKCGYAYFFPSRANMALRADVKTGKIEMFYHWDELVICDRSEEWEDDAFYLEWYSVGEPSENRNSMIIALDGKIRGADIFSVKSSEFKWPDYEDDDKVYIIENHILTIDKFLDAKVCYNASRLTASHTPIGYKIYLEGKAEKEN